MLTPQEVAEHAFPKASFGGYNMAMVDEFLDMVTNDYTTLYKDNTTLKAKMKVLADKVEEYRSTEDAMRKALLSAQRMADQMVAEAEEQKASIVAQAEKEAAEKIAAIRQDVESEQLRLTAAQNATAAYIAKLKELFENEREYLSSLSRLQAERPKPDMVADAAQAIGTAVEKAVEEELPVQSEPEPAPKRLLQEEPEEPTLTREPKSGSETKKAQEKGEETPIQSAIPREIPQEPKEAPYQSTRRIDFKNLQFGKDYTIE